jgi:pyrroline-5-carboxylate reductase
MKKTFTVSFIGTGNMGEAMIRGLLNAGVPAGSIVAHDVDAAKLERIAREYKVRAADDLAEALGADAAVVAVKPQHLDDLLAGLASPGLKLPLFISIVAGAPIARFTHYLSRKSRVVRVMPNTPALIGKGVSAYFVGDSCSRRDAELAQEIVGALGPSHEVEAEELMDAVTGLSGSGPAYVFVFIEALADAGVAMGLPRKLALDLAARTVAGAAAMVLETGEHPAALKDKVASPGGTTIAGLAELERDGFRAALYNAVEAATFRSIELGDRD